MGIGRAAIFAIALSSSIIFSSSFAATPALAQEGTAAVSSEAQAAAARKIVLTYKAGESFPLRIFEGADLFEPLAPFAATERGDWGRVFYDTAVPYGLLVGAFTTRKYDDATLREVGRWKWVGVDQKQDNNPMLYGLIALGGLSLFLPAPSEDEDGYSWALRLDRLAVFGLGMLATELETEVLKDVLKRPRPDRSDNKSRPSGHAAGTAAAMSFFADVLRDTFRPQDEPILFNRIWKEIACGLPYLGCAYVCLERVHAKKHYLSDTLLGAALGSFTMHVMYAWSFTRTEQGRSWLDMASVTYDPDHKGLMFALQGEF